jgi:hypothetical protein
MNRIWPAKTRKRCRTTISIEANVSAAFFAIMRPVFGLYTPIPYVEGRPWSPVPPTSELGA